MKITEKSFPHPVLSSCRDDVTDSSFQCLFHVDQDKKNYYLTPSFTNSNRTIARLIEEGRAAFYMHVECSSTFYRKSIIISGKTKTITVCGDYLKGKVEVNFFVCATEAIEDYSIEGAHEDYAGLTFSVRKGDILAFAESETFHADKTYEQIRPLSSIMRVIKNEDLETGIISVNYNDFIDINMPHAEYNAYFKAKNDRKIVSTLGCLVALPTLIDAISEIKERKRSNDAEASREDKWFRILEDKLESLEGVNLDEDAPIVLAQRILENPLRRGLNELFEILQDVGE